MFVIINKMIHISTEVYLNMQMFMQYVSGTNQGIFIVL